MVLKVDRNEPLSLSANSPDAQESWGHCRIPEEKLKSFSCNLSCCTKNFVCTRESSVQRSTWAIFVVARNMAWPHRQVCTHHWPCCRIFRLLHHLDQSSMEMCALQLLRPIQTALDCSPLQDQTTSGRIGPLEFTWGSFQPSCQSTELQSSFHSS